MSIDPGVLKALESSDPDTRAAAASEIAASGDADAMLKLAVSILDGWMLGEESNRRVLQIGG